MRIIYFIFLLFPLLAACNKPDPNPELKDPVYSDLIALQGSTNQALDAEIKKLEGFKQELRDVIPQSGQIKFAQKRVYESQERITKLEQEKIYYELKIKERLSQARKSYAKSFEKKEPWPDPKEWDEYQTAKKLRNAKRAWDVKQRMSEAGIGSEVAPPPKAGH